MVFKEFLLRWLQEEPGKDEDYDGCDSRGWLHPGNVSYDGNLDYQPNKDKDGSAGGNKPG